VQDSQTGPRGAARRGGADGAPPRRRWWRRRLHPTLRSLRWPAAAAAALTALLLGTIGYRQVDGDTGDVGLWIYQSIQLFALEGGEVSDAPWTLQVARLLAPAVAGYAAWQALSSVFRQQVTMLRARFTRDHVVVCGLGEKGVALAMSLVDAGHRVVAIERDGDAPQDRRLRDAGLRVLIGDAREPGVLRSARVHRARYLVAVCAEDGTNAEIVGQARHLAETSDRPVPLTIFAHMVSAELTQLLRAAATTRSDLLRLEFFNVHEGGARALIEAYPPLADGEQPPHVVIAGFGELGRSVLQQIVLRFLARPIPDDRIGGPVPQPRITVLDSNATTAVAAVLRRSPHVEQVCELSGIDLLSADQLRDIALPGSRDDPVTLAYVCMEEDAHALSMGLRLVPELVGTEGPVVVALRRSPELGELVAHAAGPALGRVHPFPLLERTCTADLVLGGMNEVLARSFHTGYLSGIQVTEPDSGETSAWEDLPEPLRESNRRAAAHVARTLDAAGYVLAPFTDAGDVLPAFTPAEVETMARLEHERWHAERLEQGYTLGERDAGRKTNPALVPWNELDEASQEYNRQWARELPRHLMAAGMQVRKRA
jgi:hypothetical protein